MSLQEEIILKELELVVLREMQATDYSKIAKDTLFEVSDSLEAVAQGQGRRRYFSHVDGDFKCRFFDGGCTSDTTAGTTWPSYCKRVHAPQDEKFRLWLAQNVDTDGKLHFFAKDFPENIPTNYLEIVEDLV